MEFGVRDVAAEAPEALLAAPEMEPEMAMEMELEKVLGTTPLSQWALNFQPWLSFVGTDPLTL